MPDNCRFGDLRFGGLDPPAGQGRQAYVAFGRECCSDLCNDGNQGGGIQAGADEGFYFRVASDAGEGAAPVVAAVVCEGVRPG